MLSATVTAAAAAALALPLAVTAPAHAATPAAPATTAAVSSGAAPSGTARPMLPGGTVAQPNGPVEVVGGGPMSDPTWFTATLPASTTGTVHAAVVFSGALFGPGDTAVQHSAEHLHALCAVAGSSLSPCAWHGDNYDDTDPYQGNVWLSLPPTPAATTIRYQVKISSDFGLFSVDDLLTGWIELTDDNGTPLADGPAQIQYRRGVEPASMRSALYGRDAAGVLWRYEGNDRVLGGAPFKPRVRVGGGWNAYTAVTPLTTPSAAATGDMVARDRNGVLWYYRHSGIPDQPFEPRRRVGGGWNIYTAVMGAGGNSDYGLLDASVGDLVARDRSGVLWWYRATGDPDRPFLPRTRVGGGWNIYTAIVESQVGLLARDSSGVLWQYDRWGTPTQAFLPRTRVGGGWNIYTALADTRSGLGSYTSGLVARDRAGKLWLYNSEYWGPTTRVYVGGGWNIYTMLF